MRKNLFLDELGFSQEAKYNFILPRCTVCRHHTRTTDEPVLHICEFYGGLTMPETLDVCDYEGSFEEVL